MIFSNCTLVKNLTQVQPAEDVSREEVTKERETDEHIEPGTPGHGPDEGEQTTDAAEHVNDPL